MATPETTVKQALNRKMRLLERHCHLNYKRLTFGPYATSGLPDRLESFGSTWFACEVKREGKKPTPLQDLKLQESRDHGIPAFYVAGKEGPMGSDNVFHQMKELFTPSEVSKRVAQYEKDCAILYASLQELTGELR